MLIDGGVYDNQGIHKLTHGKSSYKCDIIIVSDAGSGMKKILKCRNSIHLLLNTIELLMNRIKNSIMVHDIYETPKDHFIAYQSLTWTIDGCLKGFIDHLLDGKIKSEVIDAHEIPYAYITAGNRSALDAFMKAKIDYQKIKGMALSNDEYELARSVSTCLTPLSKKEISVLIKQAELLTEIQLKLYCPFLFQRRES